MARVLVCGGRYFSDTKFVYSVLDEYHKHIEPIGVLIEGDARGVDRIAGFWARRVGIDNIKFPADWDKYGKAAGAIRNRQMLEEGDPDVVLAFPGGLGTANMIALAEKAGVEVERIDYNE